MPKKDVGYLIKNINDKMKARADADLSHFSLTLSQSRVLAFLHDKGGTSTQKEIEVFLDVAHPTVVGIVSRLEKNGHISTSIDPLDRRNKIVSLTESAIVMGDEMEHNIRENEKRMLGTLSEQEVDELKRMLSVIYKNLE